MVGVKWSLQCFYFEALNIISERKHSSLWLPALCETRRRCFCFSAHKKETHSHLLDKVLRRCKKNDGLFVHIYFLLTV